MKMWITVCMWRFPWTPITPFWLHEIGFVKNIYRYPMNLYKICTITEFDEAFCIAAAISKTSLWCARFDSVQFFFFCITFGSQFTLWYWWGLAPLCRSYFLCVFLLFSLVRRILDFWPNFVAVGCMVRVYAQTEAYHHPGRVRERQ